MTELLPHQHAALVNLLRQHGGTADEVFTRLAADKNLGGLRALQFVPPQKFARMAPRQQAKVIEVEGDFPAGIPGFPNVLRRQWFDAAWTEAKAVNHG